MPLLKQEQYVVEKKNQTTSLDTVKPQVSHQIFPTYIYTYIHTKLHDIRKIESVCRVQITTELGTFILAQIPL